MILEKDNIKRTLADEETIKMFIDSGWKEVKEEKKNQKKTK